MRRRPTRLLITLLGVTVGLALWQLPRQYEIDLNPRVLMGTLQDQVLVDYGWQPLTGAAGTPAEIAVQTDKSQTLRLVFDLPGFDLETVAVDGRPCSRVGVPGLLKLQTAGLPELPVASTTLAIPGTGSVSFQVVEHVVREVKVKPVEPSKGHLTRDIDPATVVAQFSPYYDDGGVWPTRPVVMSKPFLLQTQRGVNLRFNPLRYDAGRGVLLVSERLVVDVITDGAADKSLPRPAGGFAAVHTALFSNVTERPADKYQALQTLGRLLVIAPESLADAVTPLVHWKRQRGLETDLVTVPDVGVVTADIAAIITTEYTAAAGLTWVILVGDRAEMPPAVGQYDGSDSDTRYAMVSGDDVYPDLFISRVSASTPEQVSTQVNKFITYEKFPDTGTDAGWYRRAVGIASDEGLPADSERADNLRTQLLTYGYGPVQQIYQNQGGSTADITAALATGVSLVNYLGHGSGYSWESVQYRQEHLGTVANGTKLPWIIDVSCSNGDLALDDCFAEAWLRAGTPTVPAGAVGMIASTSLSPWIPPTVMQSEAVYLLTTDAAHTLGALYYSGLMKVADQYGGLSIAERVVEQNMIFGDCSLMVRTSAPAEFLVTCPTELRRDAGQVSLDVDGPAGSVVTLTHNGDLHETAFVGTGSAVQLPLGPWAAGLEAVTVTITGLNQVPFITSVTLTGDDQVSGQDQPLVPAQVTLLGNYPNPFNPATTIAFELPGETAVNLHVYDIRGQLVRDLSTALLPAGRHEVPWDGRDRRGSPAPSGVYLYKLEAAGQMLAGRMTLSK